MPGTQEINSWGSPAGLRAQKETGWKWSPYLYSSFRQIDSGGQLGPDMDVGVVGEVEELLQFLQLLRGEGGAHSPLVLLFLCGRRHASWVRDLAVSPLGRRPCCFVLPSPSPWPLLSLGPWLLGVGG